MDIKSWQSYFLGIDATAATNRVLTDQEISFEDLPNWAKAAITIAKPGNIRIIYWEKEKLKISPTEILFNGKKVAI